MSLAVFIIVIVLFAFFNQILAGWFYEHRVRRSRKKFFARARIMYPDATISLETVKPSDLDAVETLREELEKTKERDGHQ